MNINNFQEKSKAQQKCRNLAKIHENTKIQQISRFQNNLGNQYFFVENTKTCKSEFALENVKIQHFLVKL